MLRKRLKTSEFNERDYRLAVKAVGNLRDAGRREKIVLEVEAREKKENRLSHKNNEFFERMKLNEELRKEKIEALKLLKQFDTESGDKLFEPRIGVWREDIAKEGQIQDPEDTIEGRI